MDINHNNAIMSSSVATVAIPSDDLSEQQQQQSNNQITYLVETPRGRTACTTLPPNLPYDAFVGHLWDAALERDQDNTSRSNKRSAEFSNNRNVRRRRNSNAASAFVIHNGRVLGKDEYGRLVLQKSDLQQQQPHNNIRREYSVSLRLRLRGGMVDRQNRVGSKFGGGGVSSSQNAERERKERLRQLALESIDLAKDPYLMRNHLGTYECKLCLTLHTNEANYLTHTQGKKHQAGLAKRAAMEKQRLEMQESSQMPMPLLSSSTKQTMEKKVRIGRPAYQVYKSRDYETNQRCLSFELRYPEIDKDIQPRHRFMSAFEQRVESPPDKRFQYLLVAADPYETVAFKIPNEPIDKGEGRFFTHWDAEEKQFTLTLYFMEPENADAVNAMEE